MLSRKCDFTWHIFALCREQTIQILWGREGERDSDSCGAGPKMIERVRKKNKQGIGMLNVSLQWLERLLVWLPLSHGQQYHSSWYCLVFLVRPVVVPCRQGSELLEVFLLLANRNAVDQVKLARQSRASFYPPLHPHPTLKPISPPHTHPWQRHRKRERELLVIRQSSSRFQLLHALVEFAIKTNFLYLTDFLTKLSATS